MNPTTHTRICGLALLLGAALLWSTPVLAAQTESQAAAATAAPAQIIVVRDSATGAFRGATAEEARALMATPQGAARAASPQTTEVRSHPSGARGARLTDAFMAHSIAVKLPDGRVVEACFHTADEASRAHPLVSIMKLPAPAATE